MIILEEEGFRATPRVLISCDGGLVQGITSDIKIHATVLDYDVEGADVEDLVDVPQGDGTTSSGSMTDFPVDVEPNAITAALNAKPIKEAATP
jgi:hypothetical protein